MRLLQQWYQLQQKNGCTGTQEELRGKLILELMADAWHHRSDALSSVGAFIGILGARMGYPILDPIASVVICIFIGKAAYDIFKDAVDKWWINLVMKRQFRK